jgi:hypothetical protein
MIRSNQYNKVDDKFAPKLKPGEVAIYVSARNKVVDGIPKFPTFYLPVKDTIKNPDPNADGVVDIAYITQGAPEGRSPVFGQIVFEPTEKGVITLSGSSSLAARQYAFMELTDFNGDKVGRDETKPIYFYRRKPGQRSEDAFAKAQKAADALDFAQFTPIDELRELLTNRKLKVANVSDEDVRFMALEEATKNPFRATKQAPVFQEAVVSKEQPVLNAKNIGSMFDAGIIKWSVAEKCLVNADTGMIYNIGDVKQTDKPEVKQAKLLQACIDNADYGEQLIDEIKMALKL